MKLGIEVGAAILNHSETKIAVRGFEQSGEDNATGRDSVENQRVDVIGAKDHGEIGAGERTDAMLGNNDVAFFWSDDRWDRT